MRFLAEWSKWAGGCLVSLLALPAGLLLIVSGVMAESFPMTIVGLVVFLGSAHYTIKDNP